MRPPCSIIRSVGREVNVRQPSSLGTASSGTHSRDPVALPTLRIVDCVAPRASEISAGNYDKSARRANHAKVCPSLLAKISRLTCRANQRHIPRVSPERGACARHERAVRCGGREARARRARIKRTAKSCGSDAAVLASSSRERASHERRWQKSRSPGRARSKP
jgi:hypothetical protein